MFLEHMAEASGRRVNRAVLARTRLTFSRSHVKRFVEWQNNFVPIFLLAERSLMTVLPALVQC